jgi:hypothetical protein
LRPGNLVNQNAGAGNNWVKAHYTKAGTNSAQPPCSVEAFVVNSRAPNRGTSLGS